MAKPNKMLLPLMILGGFMVYQILSKPKITTSALPSATPKRPVIRIPPSGTKDYNKWVQHSLNQIMSTNLYIDGIIGPATKQVMQEFQESIGLSPDGLIGPQTQDAIVQFLVGL